MVVPLLPDVDLLLMDILRSALADVTENVFGEAPADPTSLYPLVVAYKLPGGSAVNPVALERTLCQVNVYAEGKTAALYLAQQCRTALYLAWMKQFPYEHGSIASYAEQSAPARSTYANQPMGETFVPATYQLHVSPAVYPHL